MAKRLAACISVTVGVLAAAAGAHAADVVRTISVHAETAGTGRGATTVTLDCPSSAVALNAAVTRRPEGVSVQRSIPGRGPGDWRFRLFGATSAGTRGTRVVLRCVRLELPDGLSGARLDVSTRRQFVAIPAGGTRAVRLRCGAEWLGSGYGFDPDARGRVRLASVVPSDHGWDFKLANTGSAPARAGVRARCLKQTVTATSRRGSKQLRFRVAQRAFSNAVDAGTSTFSHRCGAGQFSLATGSIVDPPDGIELVGSGPTGTLGGRWTFRRASAGDQVRSFLVCLGQRSGFR